jgi:hypothetical protein
MKYAVLLACLLASSTAFSAEKTNTITIDLTTPLTTAAGVVKKECVKVDPVDANKCAEFRDWTFSMFLLEILDPDPRADPELHEPDKSKAGFLALRIAGAGDAKTFPVSHDDVTAILKQVAKFGDPVTLARFTMLLDPLSVPGAKQ